MNQRWIGFGLSAEKAGETTKGTNHKKAKSEAARVRFTGRAGISRCESSCENCRNEERVGLPLPVRHERGEGRGEGYSTTAGDPTLRSASSPHPSPPFRTEERETKAPVRTARTFATTDVHRDAQPPVPRRIFAPFVSFVVHLKCRRKAKKTAGRGR